MAGTSGSRSTRREFLLGSGAALAGLAGAVAAAPAPGGDPDLPPSRGPVLCLDRNESPCGAAPAVRERLKLAIDRHASYPEHEGQPARDAIARHHGVPAANVVATCGSTEALQLVFRALVREGDRVVVAGPAFSLLPLFAGLSLARLEQVPLEQGRAPDPDRFAAAAGRKAALVVLVNPHNPTGTPLPPGFLSHLLSRLPGSTAVVVDEAYHDFATGPIEESALGMLARHANLVVLRTLSKIHGLAGLRVGYAIANEPVAVELARFRLAHGVSRIAEEVVPIALSDARHVADVRQRNGLARRALIEGLDRLGLRYWRSEASFVLVEVGPDRARVEQALRARGLLVCLPEGVDRGVRITVPEQARVPWVIEQLRAARG